MTKEVLLTKTVAMPGDTNPNGDIFGGWLLSEMDVAGGILAKTIAKGRVATVAIEGMKFLLPVKVGDTVLYGKYSGTELKLENNDYLIMRESDILAIV